MFVGSNANKRSGSQVTSASTGAETTNPTDLQMLTAWKNDCKDQDGCQQIISSRLEDLVVALKNPELRQAALEVLTLITAEPSNRQTIAAHPNLMDSVEKLRMGSLSQKKLADEVHERLLDAYLMGQAMDITNTIDNMVPIGEKKTPHARQAKVMARPATVDSKAKKDEKAAEKEKEAQAKPLTVNLFVENMDEKVLGEIENCLLKCKGIVSFFSDVDDGKVIVRLTSENLVDDVIANIYENTKHRTSIIKGDYDSSGFPLYITENQQKKNEGGFFSSLYQIVSVSDHPKEKAKSGWLGSWW